MVYFSEILEEPIRNKRQRWSYNHQRTQSLPLNLLQSLSINNNPKSCFGSSKNSPDRFIPAKTRKSSLKISLLPEENEKLLASPTRSSSNRHEALSVSSRSSSISESMHSLHNDLGQARLAKALGLGDCLNKVCVYDEHRPDFFSSKHVSSFDISTEFGLFEDCNHRRKPSIDNSKRKSNELNNLSLINAPAKLLKPYKVLDAPGLRDDFYTSLVAWNIYGEMAVALLSSVYIWSSKGPTVHLISVSPELISSVSYSNDGNVLAIGLTDGKILLCGRQEISPRLTISHSGEIGVMAWKPLTSQEQEASNSSDHVIYTLLVGEGCGQVNLYTIKWFKSSMSVVFVDCHRIKKHTEQVCGLAWNDLGTQFCTGANDNKAYFFTYDKKVSCQYEWIHSAAVKAIAFCPWEKNILATGAGTKDKHLRIFDCSTGNILHKIDCGAQITSIIWSLSFKELLVAFGFGSSRNRSKLSVYAYPTFKRVFTVPVSFDEQRTNLAVRIATRAANGSIEGSDSVVIATSDQTFSFYKVWDLDQENYAGRGSRIIRWHGVLGSDVMELLEGIERGTDGQIR